MLTPRFDLDQDDNFLIVTIYAPFTNISDTEIFMEDLDFRFFSKPYFLRLHLPKPILKKNTNKASTFNLTLLSGHLPPRQRLFE